MARVKGTAARSLGDLKSELRVLRKRHDGLYEDHQRSHREFMETGVGGPTERIRLYREGQELHHRSEEIFQAAREISREIERRKEEGLTSW